MEDGNLAVLVDAKTEYTKQLVNILKQHIYFMVHNLFNEAKLECTEANTPTKVLYVFQQKLSEIPKWNHDIITTECETIITNSKCDWLDELITAVFVSHTRILTSINFNKSKGKVNLNIPKTQNFIHKCFIDVARYFWKNSYLFDDGVNKYEFQKNRRDAETMIETSINETIRKELPVKNILKKYLGKEFHESDEDDEVDDDFNDEPISKKQKKNLKKMVMKELEHCSNEQLNKMKLILDNEENIGTLPLTNEPVTDIVSASIPLALPMAEPTPVAMTPTEPVVVSVVEPVVAEPVAMIPTEPVVISVAEPVVVEPVAMIPTEPAVEPLAMTPTEPTVEPVVAEPVVVEPMTVTMTEPVPIAEPVAEPVPEPVSSALNFELSPMVDLSDTAFNTEPINKVDKNKITVKKIESDIEPTNITLDIQELNLDQLDDLSKVEQVYVNDQQPEPEPEPENNVLVNDADDTQTKNNILKKYVKNRNYSFFD